MGWSTISVQQWCKWRTTAPTTSGLCPRFSFYTKPWFFEEEVAEEHDWACKRGTRWSAGKRAKWRPMYVKLKSMSDKRNSYQHTRFPHASLGATPPALFHCHLEPEATTSAPVRAALTAATLRKTVGEREKIVSWWFGVFLKQERCRKDAGVNPFSSTRSSKMYSHTFQDLKCVTLTLPFPLPWNHCSYRPNNSQPMVNYCCLRSVLLAILASPRKEVRLEIWLYSML